MRFRFRTSRGAPGIAAVEVNWRRVGWVRRYTDGWRYTMTDIRGYSEESYATRAEAADALVEKMANSDRTRWLIAGEENPAWVSVQVPEASE